MPEQTDIEVMEDLRAMEDRRPLLRVQDVTLRFGGVVALDKVDFTLYEGEILGLIGPNGAGKTTCFNAMTGVYRPTSGDIKFDGVSVTGKKRYQITRLGIGRTFQVVKPFASMTARENAAVGALFGSASARLPTREAFVYADEMLELVGLADKGSLPVASLTVPDRKRLEVARALCTRPRLLLLDEVMAGLNAVEVDAALGMVRDVHARGVTIVLIEHVMRVIVGVCERVIVLHLGRHLAEGRPQEVLKDARVIEAYLGEKYARRHGHD